jgi:hypothetical protein
MAKKPEADPNALLCTTCDKQVEKDENGDFVHKSKGVKDHEVIKTIKFSDWSDKINKLRGIKPSEPVKKGKKGKKASTEKKSDAKPGPKPAEPEKIKPKSLAQRNRRYKRADMGIENWTKEQNEKKAALEAKKAEAERTLPDLYYHETKGLHYPKANSMTPVINPATREIVVPKTGAIMGKFRGAIPTDVSKPSEVAGQDHVDSHPEHAWETAVDPRSIEKTGQATPLIGPGVDTDSKRGGRIDDHYSGMLEWAHEHKKLFDQADRYEYTLARPTLTLGTENKNNLFTRQDALQYPNTWMVKRRLKFCADCAPTVLDPGTGKRVRTRTQSVTRPAPLELPFKNTTSGADTGEEGTKRPQTIRSIRQELGLVDTQKRGPIPASIAPRALRTEGFVKGSGEGKATGAE